MYACLLDESPVAIKRLPADAAGGDPDGLLRGLAAVGAVNHANVLAVSGVCVAPPVLVYPLMRGGSVADRLALRNSHDPPLTALQRLSIAVGAARGVAAIHARGLAHRRVKAANVLLDDAHLDMSAAAQLTDAGLPADFCEPTDSVHGGYLDPEWSRSRTLGAKSDVYCLGVLLLELMSSHPAYEAAASPPGIVARFRMHEGKGLALPLFADRSPLVGWPPPLLEDLAALASRCLEAEGKGRPGAAEVARELERLEGIMERRVAAASGGVVGGGGGGTGSGPRTGARARASATAAATRRGS